MSTTTYTLALVVGLVAVIAVPRLLPAPTSYVDVPVRIHVVGR